MKENLDTIKLWLANTTAIAVAVADLMTPFLEFVGVLAATTYTVWKLYLLAKEQNAKRKANKEL